MVRNYYSHLVYHYQVYCMLKGKETVVDYSDMYSVEEIEAFNVLQIIQGEKILFKTKDVQKLLDIFKTTKYYDEVVQIIKENE